MALSDMFKGLDFNKFVDYLMDMAFKVLRIPFDFWNNLAWYIKIPIYAIILLFSIFLAYVTWKYREAWRYFS